MSNQFQLMREQRYRPFFFTQFLGAFNDNVFKTVLITLVTFHASSLTQMDGGKLATLLPGLFILPFFLFSATAGQIADKYEKSKIIRLVKIFEICIMLFASAGFYLHQIGLLACALFMMGMHSTLFGPVKYAYLPQHLNETELVGGNGMLEMGSFVAILLGQVLGAWLGDQQHHVLVTTLTVLGLAGLGYLVSCSIPHSPAGAPHLKICWNPLSATYRNLSEVWHKQNLWISIIGISWFWFYGATLLAQFPNLAKTVFHGDGSVFILLLSTFSLGIGIGSLLCEKLSKHHVELGLVLLGASGLSLFGIDFYLACHASQQSDVLRPVILDYLAFMQQASHWRVLADIIGIGLFGGLYIVPLYAYIQSHAKKSHQSRVIAANNIMNALFMVISAGFSLWVFEMGFDIPQLFLITALLNMLIMAYLCWRQPEYLNSFITWLKK
jgi:MFS family permease